MVILLALEFLGYWSAMEGHLVTILLVITQLMLFVVKWDILVKWAGHPVVSGTSSQTMILPWTTFVAAAVNGVRVHFHFMTIVVTVKTCFYNVKEVVSRSYEQVSKFWFGSELIKKIEVAIKWQYISLSLKKVKKLTLCFSSTWWWLLWFWRVVRLFRVL